MYLEHLIYPLSLWSYSSTALLSQGLFGCEDERVSSYLNKPAAEQIEGRNEQ